MIIKATKISVPNFQSLVKRMLLMDSSVYINIDQENTYSNVYIPSKDVVKSYSVQTPDVFQFSSPIEKTIKMSFFSGQKLLSSIAYFDPHNLSADISVFEDGDELFADKITLSDGRLKIDLFCQDQSLGFTYLSEDQVGRALDKSSKEFSFTFPREDLIRISSMLSMDQSELFQIYADSEGVHIKTEVFDLVVDDKVKFDEPGTEPKSTFKSFVSRIDKENYDVTVCSSKLILDSTESATKVAMNLAITE
jgi:hypothetical protein